ncbi:unnamed protein product, partial [Choristocarpus tenellus]
MYGGDKPVRLCQTCSEEATAENLFMEHHAPLLIEGSTMVRQKKLRVRTPIHLQANKDISVLVQREPCRSGAVPSQLLPLKDMESVVAMDQETPPVFIIRLSDGKGEVRTIGKWEDDFTPEGDMVMRLEVSSPGERDAWVSALGAALCLRGKPRLSESVEDERLRRREKEEVEAREKVRAKQRTEHNDLRARMAAKYNLDPSKYMYTPDPNRVGGAGLPGGAGGLGSSGSGVGGRGRTRQAGGGGGVGLDVGGGTGVEWGRGFGSSLRGAVG